MPYPIGTLLPRSRWARENVAKGTGLAVLRILDHQAVTLTPAAREHIAECKDLDLARIWLDQSLTATVQAELTGLDAL